MSAQSASGRNWHTRLIFERSLHKRKLSPWSQKISDLRQGIQRRPTRSTHDDWPPLVGISISDEMVFGRKSPGAHHRARLPRSGMFV